MTGDERVEYAPTTDEVLAWLIHGYEDLHRDRRWSTDAESMFRRWLAAHDAEVIAQRPGVDVEAIERVLAPHVHAPMNRQTWPTRIYDAWDEAATRSFTEANETADRMWVEMVAAEIAALAPAPPLLAIHPDGSVTPARPSVSAEQVEAKSCGYCRGKGYVYNNLGFGRITTTVCGICSGIGVVDVREVPGE